MDHQETIDIDHILEKSLNYPETWGYEEARAVAEHLARLNPLSDLEDEYPNERWLRVYNPRIPDGANIYIDNPLIVCGPKTIIGEINQEIPVIKNDRPLYIEMDRKLCEEVFGTSWNYEQIKVIISLGNLLPWTIT